MTEQAVGNIIQLSNIWIDDCSIVNGYILTSANIYVHFFANNCYDNPRIDDQVQVKYEKVVITAKVKETMSFNTDYRAIQVIRLDLDLVTKASKKIYRLTDGMILLDPSKTSIRTVTEVMKTIASDSVLIEKEHTNLVEKKLVHLDYTKKAQIAFLVDCTGSMNNCILHMKNITCLQNHIHHIISDSVIEFAFVGYRDYGEEMPPVVDFTTSALNFQHLVQDIIAYGGSDICEDVYSGLKNVTYKLSWNTKVPTKIIFFLADAPTHGNFFSDGAVYDDNDPTHDFDGNRTSKILHDMYYNKNIKMIFMRLNGSTDQMILTFNKLLSSSSTLIHTISVTDINHIIELSKNLIVVAMSKAFTKILSTPIDIPSKKLHYKKISTMIKHTDADTKIHDSKLFQKVSSNTAAQYVKLLKYKYPTSIDEIKEPLQRDNDKTLKMIIYQDELFGKGGVRYVYNAIDITLSEHVPYMFKVHQKFVSSFEDEYKVRVDLQTQAIACFLAKEFCKNNTISKPVRYVNSYGIQYQDASDNIRFASIETKLDGKFMKWSNNNNYLMNICNTDWSATMEAFTHWTYHFTNGYLMITDIQGIVKSDEYILTDPAIHCTDINRFGDTNFGKKGMEIFFQKHKCNQICKTLKLDKHKCQPTDVIYKGTSVKK